MPRLLQKNGHGQNRVQNGCLLSVQKCVILNFYESQGQCQQKPDWNENESVYHSNVRSGGGCDDARQISKLVVDDSYLHVVSSLCALTW